MRYTGKELYNRWVGFQADQNVECDPWSDLDDSDRYSWEQLAAGLSSESTQLRG